MKIDKEFLEKYSIKAVIFDMDGLLIDSEPLWQEAEIAVFTKLGVPLTPKMSNETMGLRVDEVVNYWFSRYPWKNVTKNEVVAEISEKVIQLITEKDLPMPAAVELIKHLSAARIPMAIASSSSLKIIRSVTRRLDIDKFLTELVSAEFENKGKPDPAVYLSAAKKLGIEPKYCLTFEDAINGLKSAKSAETICIAVPSRDIKNDERFKMADFKIESLTELL